MAPHTGPPPKFADSPRDDYADEPSQKVWPLDEEFDPPLIVKVEIDKMEAAGMVTQKVKEIKKECPKCKGLRVVPCPLCSKDKN